MGRAALFGDFTLRDLFRMLDGVGDGERNVMRRTVRQGPRSRARTAAV